MPGLALAGLLALLGGVACGGGSGPPGPATADTPPDTSGETRGEGALRGRLTLTGSSTVAPLAAEIGKRFERLHPGVRVDVQTGGSARGIADARRGLADIGMVSRALHPDEDDLRGFTLARDGVALIVHRDNPVRELAEDRIADIYRGHIDRWSTVGGPDREIVVVHKAEGRSTLEVFLEHFRLDNGDVRPDVVIGDNQQGIKTVAANRDAIGYVSIGAAAWEAEHGTPIRLLPLRGVPATVDAVEDGRYPLSRRLLLVTRGEPTGLARALIRFATSAAARDLVESQYLVAPAR